MYRLVCQPKFSVPILTLPVGQFCLIYKGKILGDHENLADRGIGEGMVVTLSINDDDDEDMNESDDGDAASGGDGGAAGNDDLAGGNDGNGGNALQQQQQQQQHEPTVKYDFGLHN